MGICLLFIWDELSGYQKKRQMRSVSQSRPLKSYMSNRSTCILTSLLTTLRGSTIGTVYVFAPMAIATCMSLGLNPTTAAAAIVVSGWNGNYNKFELEHIGINTPNAEEAEKLAKLLSMMFNLESRHGQKSEFGGPYFECMKAPFLGTYGHIAMRTSDLTAATKELKEKGFSFNMDTAAYSEDNKLKNVYLDGEFGGFAIHISTRPLTVLITSVIVVIEQYINVV